MSETVKYKQMSYKQLSIYDFLPEEKSQEVQPSESVPQVDEAQEEKRIPVMFRHEWKTESPSSALDTRKTWEKIVDFEASLTKESTEDTDSTLFSVGETVKVINPYDVSSEDYSYMETVSGQPRVITSDIYITQGGKKHYNTVLQGEKWLPSNEVPFYVEELQKI